MGLPLPQLQSSLLLMLLLRLPAASTNLDWQCPRIPYAASRDFSVKYAVPSFSAGGRVQATAAYEDSKHSAVFVATRNRLHVLGPDLQFIESLTTGPVGDPDCQTCASCGPGPHGPPNDTDTLVLVMEPGLPALVSCGSTLQGRCFLHELEFAEKALRLAAPACLFSANSNQPEACPDCVASPLGTRVTVVEQGHASFFYVASSLDPALAASFSPRSVSIRRLKADTSGFQPGFPSLSVLPKYLASYLIKYVYSFHSGGFVYFLTVQPISVTSPPSALQTRLVRLNAVEPEIGDYRELVLDCHFAPKRRRRGASESTQPYPVLQAAHTAPVDAKLAVELSISEGQEVLFGVFVSVKAGGSGMGPNSVVCAFPIRLLDIQIEDGVESCCHSANSSFSRPRGLDFFQTPSFCPNPVSRKSGPLTSWWRGLQPQLPMPLLPLDGLRELHTCGPLQWDVRISEGHGTARDAPWQCHSGPHGHCRWAYSTGGDSQVTQLLAVCVQLLPGQRRTACSPGRQPPWE